jgi:hypothetical protein
MAIGPELLTWDYKSGKIHDVDSGAFVSNDGVIIGATPNGLYSQDALEQAVVIGLIQSWRNDQDRIVPEIFEVGSSGKYILASQKVNGAMQISRIVYHGPNLLAVLANPGELPVVGGDVNDTAGYGNFLINLGASFFAKPIGLVFMFRDSNNKPVGSFFIENGIIQQHGISGGASNPIVGENAVIRYERIYPLAHTQGVTPVVRFADE